MRELKFFCVLVLFGSVATSGAYAQSLSLDDNPAAPSMSPFGMIPGLGAEDEFGLSGLGGLAPSPSLVLAGIFDGDIISPGVPPAFAPFFPNGSWIDAFSTNHRVPADRIRIDFSVDRVGNGIGALVLEAGLMQQMGDIYRSTASFPSPVAMAAGVPGLPAPYGGVLASAGVPGGSNGLLIDESVFGLLAGLPAPIGPGVPGGPLGPGTHDNVDAYDHMPQVATPGGATGVYPVWSYFAIAPDEAAVVNAAGFGPVSAADLFDVPPLTGGTGAVAYAPAGTMGLDVVGGLNSDSIDALVMFDRNILGGPAHGPNLPGAEPGIDVALFSLAPGSATLAQLGLNAGDVFITTFTGNFATYAFATDLGIAPAPGGPPFLPGNMDAMEIIPEPSTLVLAAVGALLGLLACAWRKRRRR